MQLPIPIPAPQPGHILAPHPQRNRPARKPTPLRKPPPTIPHIAQPHPPNHPAQRARRPATAPQKKHRPRPNRHPRHAQQPHLHDGQARQHALRMHLMPERNTLDPGTGIVADIHMGVDHIVEDGPGHAAGVQGARGCSEMGVFGGEEVDAEGREAQKGAPREGQAEDELRIVGDALGERVGGDEGEGGDGDGEAGGRELEEDGEAGEELDAGEEDGVGRGYGAAGEGP